MRCAPLPLLLLLLACAPPLGVGPAPTPMAAGAKPTASFSTTVAPGNRKQSVQGSAALTAKLARFFAIEGGLVSTVTKMTDGPDSAVAVGAFPYARPTIIVGPVQLGGALSGFAMGGGGGGVLFGVAEGRASVHSKRVSGWGSALTFSSEAVGGGRARSRELAGGLELRFKHKTSTIGLGLELRSGRTTLGCGSRCSTPGEISTRQTTVGLKLRLIGVAR